MADVKKMATRDGYGKALVALGAEHEDIVVLDADLAGSTKTGMFAKAYPDHRAAPDPTPCGRRGYLPPAPVR